MNTHTERYENNSILFRACQTHASVKHTPKTPAYFLYGYRYVALSSTFSEIRNFIRGGVRQEHGDLYNLGGKNRA